MECNAPLAGILITILTEMFFLGGGGGWRNVCIDTMGTANMALLISYKQLIIIVLLWRVGDLSK